MIKEVIILAGGLGTRLRSVVSDVPKCMAPIAGKPFLHYLTEYLIHQGINHFIFSVGYKHEIIEDYFHKNYAHLKYQVSLENEPLGTGGAIQLACNKASDENVLICNGDTLYKIDIAPLSRFHEYSKAECTLCLKPMQDFDRYGVIELNEDDSIKSFKEKQYYKSGLINGGVYALNVGAFLNQKLSQKFSFEKDYLEKKIRPANEGNSKLYGLVQDKYFIDIGIPEDYEKAEKEFKII